MGAVQYNGWERSEMLQGVGGLTPMQGPCAITMPCALGMTPLPACLSSGVAERAAKSADLISTIQMLVDMVGAAGVGDGGRWGCGMDVRVWERLVHRTFVLGAVHGHAAIAAPHLCVCMAITHFTFLCMAITCVPLRCPFPKRSPPNFLLPPCIISSPPSLRAAD